MTDDHLPVSGVEKVAVWAAVWSFGFFWFWGVVDFVRWVF